MTTATHTTAFILNGRAIEVAAPGGRRLLDVLRLDLGLTGTKEGCSEGECGACSVLVDGVVVDACLVPLCQVAGRTVRTVEGLATDGMLDPLQAALLETGGVQCGLCIPGVLMAGRAFLDEADGAVARDETAIREAIAGNLCRCTGYARLVDAVRLAAEGGVGPVAVPDGAATPWDPPVAAVPAGAWSAGTLGDGAGGSVAGAAGTEATDPDAVCPTSFHEALALLATGVVRPVAGGTDVLAERASGARRAGGTRAYLDLSRLPELHGIHLDDGALVLGAATTFAELRRSALVLAEAPVLAEMAAQVGAAQVQSRGTLGGNLATASPAGDSLPVLLALDADIVLRGLLGERTVPAWAFFPAYRQTAMEPGELIVRIRIPRVAGRTAVFRKVGRRRAQAISVVSLAVAWRTEGRTWRDVRIAAGSVAPVPMRAPETEGVLEGMEPGPEVAARAGAALVREISPIDDVRSTADYRRAVARRILARIVTEAAG